ncbi:MAG: c-type cytochrome biogenesis protein CcmI [Gammaproteobacteria bacterium]|nr:c-type cytochrome biogenesis protein CcmI [Gammaproteobacteria bacterium]
MLFWLSAGLLLALALALMVPSLLGARRRADAGAAGDAAVGVYRTRLAELDEEHRLGMLGASELEQARTELARELLAEDDAAPDAVDPAAPRRRRLRSALAVALLVPALSLSLYGWLGEPGALGESGRAPDDERGEPHAARAELEAMTARLAERMRAEPDNAEGWLLLARSYMTLDRHAAAAAAYEAAHRLRGDDPVLLADMAQAKALARGDDFLGEPAELLERALALDPDQPKALWLGGFAAAQRGEPALAAARWRRLLEQQPQGSEGARILAELVARIGAEPAAPAGATAPEAPAASLEVTVRIDERLADRVSDDDVVFVFARAVDGPPMPLAVARTRVGELPATIRLDDDDAMAPGMRLSAFARVVVGARVSRSGEARAASGDLQGLSAAVAVADGAPVEVVISEIVP